MKAILVVSSLVLVFLLILLPDHPKHFNTYAIARLPLELPLIVLLLMLVPASFAKPIRVALVSLLAVILLLRLADLGSYMAFGRRFSPLLELHLLGDGWNLASASVGRMEAAAVVLFAVILLVSILGLVYIGLRSFDDLSPQFRRILGGSALLLLSIGLTVLIVDRAAPEKEQHGRVQADLVPDVFRRVQRMHFSIVDQQTFVMQLAEDPLTGDNELPDFSYLSGRDVVLAFVESYGRSFVDDERFRGDARRRLLAVEETIRAADLHVRSAWLTAPIRGGRSWLSHATLASGLEINNQARYDRLVASQRQSLNRLFRAAGWRTAGLMPAIQLAWPEGAWYGFDITLNRDAMAYAGEPFAWVSMPDQYTLSAFETMVRQADDQPVMAEIALISSHAPWTPLTRMVPWEQVGDGSIFDGSHRFGPEPSELWKEHERVRDHYALSLDYSLEVLGSYLERFGHGAFTIIVGDHQPASIIDGWGATADVPIHIIADDRALLERLPDEWWTDGMIPSDNLPSQPMESFREALARSYSTMPDPQDTSSSEQGKLPGVQVRP